MVYNKIGILMIIGLIILLSCVSTPMEYRDGPIIFYGDTRAGHDIHRKIVKQIQMENPAAIIHSGDFVDNGNMQEQWDHFFEIIEPISEYPLYPIRGNHDGKEEIFLSTFNLEKSSYTISLNDIKFIILDVYQQNYLDNSEIYKWFVKELKEAKKFPYTIILTHEPVYSSGRHGNSVNLQKFYVKIFEKYGVDIVISGHDHNYERSLKDGIIYITTGGGGAALYDKNIRPGIPKNDYSQLYLKEHHYCKLYNNSEGLFFMVLNEEGKEIDSFRIPQN